MDEKFRLRLERMKNLDFLLKESDFKMTVT